MKNRDKFKKRIVKWMIDIYIISKGSRDVLEFILKFRLRWLVMLFY